MSYEIWPEQIWDIYDPVDAHVVATLYDEKTALMMLDWFNERRSLSGDDT